MDFQMWQFKKQIVERRAPGEQGRLSHSAKTLGLAVSRFRYLILIADRLTTGLPPPNRCPAGAHKRKRPDNRGAPKWQAVKPSGGDLGRLDFAGTRDRDRPRLHRLWDLAHEVDVQEPVLQARTLDLHMVGELEAAFEVPRGDALVEHFATLLLVIGLFLAPERQRVLLCLDREISVGEARRLQPRCDSRSRRSARCCRADSQAPTL